LAWPWNPSLIFNSYRIGMPGTLCDQKPVQVADREVTASLVIRGV
jgi:hypothetical protein